MPTANQAGRHTPGMAIQGWHLVNQDDSIHPFCYGLFVASSRYRLIYAAIAVNGLGNKKGYLLKPSQRGSVVSLLGESLMR